MSSDEEPRVVQDQPYDESMDVIDGEEVASVYTPVPHNRKLAGLNSSGSSTNRSKHLTVPAHDSSIAAAATGFRRGERLPESPTTSPKPGNDDTQDESDSEPQSSSQVLNGQKEYKTTDSSGGYDPTLYKDLPVSTEIKDIFKYIDKYQPQDIVLDVKLKPFIPEYVPAIGDIDAFLKVPRPDGKDDGLGLIVLDEPSAKQSDPHVLDLHLRHTSKQATSVSLPSSIRSVPNADKQPKALDEWINNISQLQKAKAVDTVHYQKPFPDTDFLMQEWPTKFEELLKETSAPPADLDVDLTTYADISCALLDIPVYKSRVQSLHALFTLYLGFKNSEHFKAMIGDTEDVNRRENEADRMIID